MGILNDIKQSKFDSPYEKALVNILYTNNWLRDQQKDYFNPFDIKEQHYNVLRILKGKYPAASCPGDIKEVMLDKSPDLTRLIDKLTKLGYVDRNVCELNRRKVDVVITEKGLTVLDEIKHNMQLFYAQWKEKLTDNEAEKLSDLLDKLRA
jgi:DNA-binding MarR family transcriptional regulator